MSKDTLDYKNLLPKVAGQNKLTMCHECICFVTSLQSTPVCIKNLSNPITTVSYMGCEDFKAKSYPEDIRKGVIIVFPIHRTKRNYL